MEHRTIGYALLLLDTPEFAAHLNGLSTGGH